MTNYFEKGRTAAMLRLENAMSPQAAQAEFNLGAAAAKQGQKRVPPSLLMSEGKKHWLAGYDSVGKAHQQAMRESEDWHEAQRGRKYRR